MFNDRDLGVLGAGALLAVFCLVLPLPFVGKVLSGLSVLVGFILLALLRLGPDRIPLEEWLLRRLRFRLQARRYTYQQPGYSEKQAGQRRPRRFRKDPDQPVPADKSSGATQVGRPSPAALAVDEVGIYPLVTVGLAVSGIYFLVWLAQGGAAEIAQWIGAYLP